MIKYGAPGAADEISPVRFALCLAGFTVLCAAALAIGNAPVPILHDMSEPYAWGRQFQLGYNQHPPFWAWICGAWFAVMPRALWSFAALDAVNAAIGLAGAWALIGDFARGPRRVAAFCLLLLTPIYTLGAYKYDANTIFLSVWPWTTHAFLVALRTRRLAPSLAFGALVGVALLCKYYAVLLVALCALAALATRDGRAWLMSSRPWIAAAVAAAVFAPHAVWLLETGAPPLRYFGSASGLDTALVWRSALASAGNVALNFIGVAAVLAYFAWSQRKVSRAPAPDPEATRLLLILGLGPLVLTFVAGVALRVRLTPEMPIGVLALAPLLLIDAAGLADLTKLARFTSRAAVVVTLAIALLSPSSWSGAPISAPMPRRSRLIPRPPRSSRGYGGSASTARCRSSPARTTPIRSRSTAPTARKPFWISTSPRTCGLRARIWRSADGRRSAGRRTSVASRGLRRWRAGRLNASKSARAGASSAMSPSRARSSCS